MKRTAEIAERENDFKGRCNVDSFELDHFLDILKRMTGIELPNVITIYRNKVWDFERFYDKQDKLFFDNNYLRVIVMNYLDEIVIRCYKNYLLFANAMLSAETPMFIKRLVLRSIVKNIEKDIGLITSLEVSDLPDLLEIGINNKIKYSCLMPDTIISFTNKCLDELKDLGFDMENDVNMVAILLGSAELRIVSENLLEREGIEKRLGLFEKFKRNMKIDIDSNFRYFVEDEKSPYHL